MAIMTNEEFENLKKEPFADDFLYVNGEQLTNLKFWTMNYSKEIEKNGYKRFEIMGDLNSNVLDFFDYDKMDLKVTLETEEKVCELKIIEYDYIGVRPLGGKAIQLVCFYCEIV
ncbi:MAG: hypothetical protein ACOCP8_00825 [archaeon]